MSTVLVSLILGAGGLATAFYTLLTNIRDRKSTIAKQQSDLRLSKGTYEKIAADAAQINSDQRIETERWWKEQFDAVRVELAEEQKTRRRLTKWAVDHQEWDKRAWTLALLSDPDYPSPPTLDHD